jgi:hypothetical protein
MTRLLLCLALAGCAESLRPDAQPDAAPPTGDALVRPPGPFSTVGEADGSFTTIVDSSSATEWVYGDFETRAAIDAAGPWDLRFQRFHISTNGGVSGTAGVEVAALAGVTFAQVTAAPATGFTSDAPDGDDANLDPDYAFEQGDGWYDYDSTTHVLTPKPLVWVVKTAGGSTLKLEISRYYDDAGTAGFFTVHWALLGGS